jgi:VWFA-related protein
VARRNDSVALFAFNQKVQLVAPFYDNWKQISHRIKKLNPKGDTALFDAICAATQWLAEDQRQARHIIIVATDGEENSSKATLSSTIAAALRSEASIYSINVNYEVGDPDAKQGEQILKALSDGTGGVYLRADQDGGVGDAFSRIRNQLRNQYALAYKPSDLLAQPFHRLLVLVPKNLRVHCRPGYYVK